MRIDLKAMLEPSLMGAGDSQVLDFERVKEQFPTIHKVDDCWLFIKGDEYSTEYALCRFRSSNLDGSDLKVSHIFSGWGTGKVLREMRHTYWGEDFDGYTFYLPGMAVIKALGILKLFFDMD